jgi:hypothetical protein
VTRIICRAALVGSIGLLTLVGAAHAAPARQDAERAAKHARIVEHWSAARRAAAMPRDLVVDQNGQAYLRARDGSLQPYGLRVAEGAGAMKPNARPGGDTTPPTVTNMDPAQGASISTTSYTFKATVTDTSGLRSVTFRVQKSGSNAQSFQASLSSNNVWTLSLSGLTDGSWSWSVVAKDTANNTRTTTAVFTVATGGGGGGGDGIVENAPWENGGAVQTAAGRIYFEMPSNPQRKRWAGYVCSGTVVTDGVTGRSTILTAAHCVYDDANKAFARNVLFIPNQAGTTGAGTDTNCGNDPLGCWTPAYGVVDGNWTTRTFPANIPWDYAFYVVDDTVDSHNGNGADGALDTRTGTLPVSFAAPSVNLSGSDADYTHALGYSYSDDPEFMYCAEDMTNEGADNWWLPSCGLSGGSSGGPWVQGMSAQGSGNVISVNSWGYTNEPGMAGPKLSGTSASCIFDVARFDTTAVSTTDGNEGKSVGSCP